MAKRLDDIARLRHRITIEQLTLTAGEDGQFGGEWQAVSSHWAEITPLNRGGESIFAEQLVSPVSHRITLRYVDGIKPSMRVKYGERMFNIRSVICPEERRQWLELLAEEYVAQ